MIQVNVKCFSQVKYALDTNEIKLELEAGTTTVELEKIIREKASGKLDQVSLRVAINQKYVPNETELKNLEKRDDGKFEILDVKLDNRKTKNLSKNLSSDESKIINNEVINESTKPKVVSNDVNQ